MVVMGAVVEEVMVVVDKAMETAVADMVAEDTVAEVVAAAAMVMTATTAAVETLVSLHFDASGICKLFGNDSLIAHSCAQVTLEVEVVVVVVVVAAAVVAATMILEATTTSSQALAQ